MKLALRISTFAEDRSGTRVYLSQGDEIWDIQDAGPQEVTDYTNLKGVQTLAVGWNVSFQTSDGTYIMDAVELLKALEGNVQSR